MPTKVPKPLSPVRHAILTVMLMAATVMVVLDTTIANVALPHMQTALGANHETIAWVLTSYILATAVATPLTGWLAGKFGRRALFTAAVAGFTLSSAMCGMATSLPMMVFARFLQGLFGAFIIPLCQAILYDINPPEKYVQTMTIWGMGIMIGPIMGPLLGGWLTDAFDWRWVFFINVPIGIISGFGTWALLAELRGPPRPFDMLGFILLAVMLCCLQLVLDRGTQLDWYESPEIIIETGVMLACLWMLIIHMRHSSESILPIGLFKDQNYLTAIFVMMIVGSVATAGAALMAPMMQQLLGYPVLEAGIAVAPRGVGTVIGMMIIGPLLKFFSPRVLLSAGLALIAVSLYMMTGFSLEMDDKPILITGLIQGLGMGMVMTPMNLIAYATLPAALRTDGMSINMLGRNLGASVAVAVLTALLARSTQTSHSDLVAHVTATSVPLLGAGLPERYGIPSGMLTSMMDLEINRQALFIAYLNDYWVMMWAALIMVPIIFIFGKIRNKPDPDAPKIHTE